MTPTPSVPETPPPADHRRRALRWVTVAVLAVFLLVTVVTGAVSLGSYCLTTHGADTRALPADHRPPTASGVPARLSTPKAAP